VLSCQVAPAGIEPASKV